MIGLLCGELFLPALQLRPLTYAHSAQRHARFTRALRHPRGNPQLLPTPHPPLIILQMNTLSQTHTHTRARSP